MKANKTKVNIANKVIHLMHLKNEISHLIDKNASFGLDIYVSLISQHGNFKVI